MNELRADGVPPGGTAASYALSSAHRSDRCAVRAAGPQHDPRAHHSADVLLDRRRDVHRPELVRARRRRVGRARAHRVQHDHRPAQAAAAQVLPQQVRALSLCVLALEARPALQAGAFRARAALRVHSPQPPHTMLLTPKSHSFSVPTVHHSSCCIAWARAVQVLDQDRHARPRLRPALPARLPAHRARAARRLVLHARRHAPLVQAAAVRRAADLEHAPRACVCIRVHPLMCMARAPGMYTHAGTSTS